MHQVAGGFEAFAAGGATQRIGGVPPLDPRALQAIAQVYPVFVGAVVERYAPFVRPDWFRRTFGI